MLRGENKPGDNVERMAFAEIAYDRKSFATAARLWAEVLAADPKLGDDLRAGHRYDAACAAALAAACQGIDEPEPDDATRTKLRRQSLEWLQDELLAWSRQLEKVRPQDRQVFTRPLARWKSGSDLASIRDAVALAKLPAEEQRGWRDFWTAVDSLLKNAKGDRP
jgi:eukaryotic-like serine/threonine-protein kinase